VAAGESPEYDAAITGDGVIIDNDFFIRPTKDPECPSLFIGAVRFLGATIGGQLGIRGTCIIANPYKGPVPAAPAASPAPTRAPLPAHFAALAPSVSWDQITEPAISMRDAIVKGGIFVRPMEAIPSYILGELRLNDAEINGVFSIRGCHLVAGKNGRAITADGVQIKGDLTIGQALANPLDPSEYPQCTIEGVIRLPGATIGEEFRISDATLDSRGQERAIIASRATVAGGLLIETSKPQDKSFRCEVLGELRFNYAHIGRRFSLTGILLKASRCRECLAIGAIGMQLAGDFEIDSCQIIGEIRVIGADIAGSLQIQSGSSTPSPIPRIPPIRPASPSTATLQTSPAESSSVHAPLPGASKLLPPALLRNSTRSPSTASLASVTPLWAPSLSANRHISVLVGLATRLRSPFSTDISGWTAQRSRKSPSSQKPVF
jgi:hypothetical protein